MAGTRHRNQSVHCGVAARCMSGDFLPACLEPRGESKRCATAAFATLLLNGSQLVLQHRGGMRYHRVNSCRHSSIVSISAFARKHTLVPDRVGEGQTRTSQKTDRTRSSIAEICADDNYAHAQRVSLKHDPRAVLDLRAGIRGLTATEDDYHGLQRRLITRIAAPGQRIRMCVGVVQCSIVLLYTVH